MSRQPRVVISRAKLDSWKAKSTQGRHLSEDPNNYYNTSQSCHICGRYQDRPAEREEHYRTVHRGARFCEDYRQWSYGEWACHICGEDQPDSDKRAAHYKRYHPDDRIKWPQGQPKDACQIRYHHNPEERRKVRNPVCDLGQDAKAEIIDMRDIESGEEEDQVEGVLPGTPSKTLLPPIDLDAPTVQVVDRTPTKPPAALVLEQLRRMAAQCASMPTSPLQSQSAAVKVAEWQAQLLPDVDVASESRRQLDTQEHDEIIVVKRTPDRHISIDHTASPVAQSPVDLLQGQTAAKPIAKIWPSPGERREVSNGRLNPKPTSPTKSSPPIDKEIDHQAGSPGNKLDLNDVTTPAEPKSPPGASIETANDVRPKLASPRKIRPFPEEDIRPGHPGLNNPSLNNSGPSSPKKRKLTVPSPCNSRGRKEAYERFLRLASQAGKSLISLGENAVSLELNEGADIAETSKRSVEALSDAAQTLDAVQGFGCNAQGDLKQAEVFLGYAITQMKAIAHLAHKDSLIMTAREAKFEEKRKRLNAESERLRGAMLDLEERQAALDAKESELDDRETDMEIKVYAEDDMEDR